MREGAKGEKKPVFKKQDSKKHELRALFVLILEACRSFSLLQNLKTKQKLKSSIISYHCTTCPRQPDHFLVIPVSNTHENVCLWSSVFSTSPNFIIYLLFSLMLCPTLRYKFSQIEQNQKSHPSATRRRRLVGCTLKCRDGWIRKTRLEIICAIENVLHFLETIEKWTSGSMEGMAWYPGQ